MSDYFIGLDLGFSTDFSAISIIERRYEREYEYFEEFEKPHFDLTYLERFQIPYPEISQKIKVLFEDPRLRQTGELVVDATGVGLPIVQMLEGEGINPRAITIHGGEEATETKDGFRVPKKQIVSVLVAALQSARLKIAEKLEYASVFLEELQNFSYKIDRKTGHESYESMKEAVHDDLVIAAGIALWYAARDGLNRRKIIADRGGVRHYEPGPLLPIGTNFRR